MRRFRKTVVFGLCREVVLSLRFPRHCLRCRQWGLTPLCLACQRDSHAQASLIQRCRSCAAALPPGVGHCAVCESAPPRTLYRLTAVDYAAPWDAWILALKFGQDLSVVQAMALQMERAIRQHLADGSVVPPDAMPSLLVPLPLSRGRMRQRGFNQSERLAAAVGAGLGTPVLRGVLQRWVDLPPQAQTDRNQRLTRLQGVFGVPAARCSAVLGRHIALIDDVCTTGATLDAAAGALLDAGAASVCSWVYARTPPPVDAAS